MADASQLQQIVAAAVEQTVPPDHKGALAIVATDDDVQAVVAIKVNDAWEIAGTVKADYRGKLDAGVKVSFSW